MKHSRKRWFPGNSAALVDPRTLERYGIQLACIEGHPQVRQQIIDYFTARGYTLLGKYLRADTSNLWFAPLKK